MSLSTTRWGLDAEELATTGAAAIVSAGLFVTYGGDYLARGVVGDLLGFAVLTAAALRGRRLRHEALVCLSGIGVVHVFAPRWPLSIGPAAWWTAFAVGLASYLIARWHGLRRRG